MPDAQPQTIRDALREEAQKLVLVRMRRVLYIGIIGLVFSALSDLRLGPLVPRDLILVKLAGSLVEGAGVVLLALLGGASWRRSTTAAVIAFSLPCIVVSFNGSYTADPMMPTLLLPVMVVGAAMFFPWGMAAQLALVAVASAIFLPHVAALGTNLVVSVYSMLAASVYVAAVLDRSQIERKAIELLQEGHQHVLEGIAADAPLVDVFAKLLNTVRQQGPELMCAVMLLKPEMNQLHCAASFGLPDGYRQTIDGIDVGTSIEGCAVAAHTGERTIAADIATDPRWAAVRPLALFHGLRSSWSEPILSADRTVLGVVAVFHRAPRVPNVREVALIEAAARFLGIAIERREARVQLERYVQSLDSARLQAEQLARQLQEQAAQLAVARDQALASARARSQFLANMSHEIRTPLNGIIGTTEILLDTQLNPAQREYARILAECGEHLLSVINDILDLSKIEAGKVDIESVELDLRALVEGAAGVLATRAQAQGLELVCSVPAALDVTVKGDPSRLRQVLVNLVGNAIKFTKRGEVVIAADLLHSSTTHLTVRLSVRDTGIGIPPERQAAVFESFTQADGSTTRNYGGSGLGLTICRDLVHLMGGEVGLESAPGEGSTFWIDLPLERGRVAGATRQLPPDQLAGLRVLVVDDTAISRLILRRSLEGWGCRVEEAADGRAALGLIEVSLKPDPFGLVILDIQMPELDGLEIARRLRGDARLASLPLILLSSIGGLDGGKRQAREIGLAAVVSKPVRQSDLLDEMRATFGTAVVEPEHRPPAGIAVAGPAAALHVLLAEDNRVNQMVARRLLERLGCRIDVVDNGRDAVEAVARTRYDVVFMDIQMPVMDGFEATAQIRSAVAGEHLPIIAMTAHAMQGDRQRCLAAGMDDYVTKPVSSAALAGALAGLPHRDPPEDMPQVPGCASVPAPGLTQSARAT